MIVTLDTNDAAHVPSLQAQILSAFPDTDFQVEPLGVSSGDLRIELDDGRTLVFERKETPSDLLASLADGRLFEQSAKIPKICTYGFLVLVGELRYSPNGQVLTWGRNGWGETNWRRDSVEHALNRCSKSGMVVLRDITDYAKEVQSCLKDCTEYHIHARKGISYANPFKEETENRIEFIAQLPGVGPKRAMSLYNWFKESYKREPSIRDLMAAAMAPELGAKLWGPKTTSSLADWFNKEET